MSLMEAVPAGVAVLVNESVNPWTAERVEKLRALWREGYSASQIMGMMDHSFTRNAILGKVDRLKLSQDPGIKEHAKYGSPPDTRNWRPDSFRRKKYDKPATAYVSVFCEPVPPASSACGFVDLDDTKCHFPIGHPGTAAFHYCGGEVTRRLYCAGHYDVAYQRRA